MSGACDEGPTGATATAVRPRVLIPTPRVLAIGASTGGPQALSLLLGQLSPHLDHVPVLIVLHMPPDFTDVVSGHIARATGRVTRAACNGEKINPGEIYFAPGNLHLKVAKLDTTPILLHCDSPPENFCRPAVDVLFRSVAQVYGPSALGIVLTGMGVDGLEGARAMVDAGGAIIAQDKASSVVWGMPGVVAQEGLASAIVSIDTMAVHVSALLRRRTAGVAA